MGRGVTLRHRADGRCKDAEAHVENHVVDFSRPSRSRLERREEAKSLLLKTIPVARRVLGESDDLTLKLRSNYAVALYKGDAATLDDLHEAVTTLEDAARIARRVLGGAHPTTVSIERTLERSRAALRAREAAPK